MPREKGMRKIFEAANIPLPTGNLAGIHEHVLNFSSSTYAPASKRHAIQGSAQSDSSDDEDYSSDEEGESEAASEDWFPPI